MLNWFTKNISDPKLSQLLYLPNFPSSFLEASSEMFPPDEACHTAKQNVGGTKTAASFAENTNPIKVVKKFELAGGGGWSLCRSSKHNDRVACAVLKLFNQITNWF